MRVYLASENTTLIRACRTIMGRFDPGEWRLSCGNGRALDSEADCYVWDLHCCRDFFQRTELHQGAVHVVLAENGDIEGLRGRTGVALTTLVRPFSPEYFAAVLENIFESLAPAADGLAGSPLDRSQRDRLLQCLLHLNMRVQEYHVEQMNFLARALHDFRAPLTAIAGYCSLLQSQDLGPLSYRQTEMLQRVECSAKRLSRLVTDTFRLSVRHSGEKRMDMQPGNILDCLQTALDETASLASLKNLRVEYSIKPIDATLHFDRDEIARVLTNLLDNAYKFTPPDGLVELKGYPYFWERRNPRLDVQASHQNRRVASSDVPNCYRIDIGDSGPGIPDEELDRVFEPYSSYAGGKDRSGAGLGLAICRMILEAHDGTIFADSTEEGAKISVLLPVALPGRNSGAAPSERFANPPLPDSLPRLTQ